MPGRRKPRDPVCAVLVGCLHKPARARVWQGKARCLGCHVGKSGGGLFSLVRQEQVTACDLGQEPDK